MHWFWDDVWFDLIFVSNDSQNGIVCIVVIYVYDIHLKQINIQQTKGIRDKQQQQQEYNDMDIWMTIGWIKMSQNCVHL